MMASRRVLGSPHPPDTPDRAVFRRSLLGTAFAFGNSTAINSFSPVVIAGYETLVAGGSYTGPRFAEIRLLRIEVWDSAANEATDSSLTVTTNTTSGGGGDNAIFRDYSTPGAERAHIAIIPNFALRAQWFSTSTSTVLFTLGSTGTQSATSSPIIRLTIEMR